VIQTGGRAQEDTFDLTIVIPCLNEESNVEGTLDAVVEAMKVLPYTYEILVIDDGSTDATVRIVEKYSDTHPELPIRLHRNPTNRGLTRSYVDGAFQGRGKYYRMVCGDNVEPKETLVTIFRQIGKADMIIPYHAKVKAKPALRLGLSRLYTFLVNWLSGYRIRYYNGLAVHLRYNVMRWGPYSFGFGFQAELITRLLDEGATYIEIPVATEHKEKSGRNSAVNLKNFLSVGHTLLEVLIRRIRKRAFSKK
jgi:glycosyltransferase involved in cell wall biosynthesis